MNWYVVQTKPNSEMLALTHLSRQGFSVWLPKCSRIIRHARQTKEVLRPFFPGYLFVQFDPKRARWRAINSTVGVIRLVSFSSSPSILDAKFIENLKACENQDGIIESDHRSPQNISVGDAVEILNGPMAGVVGKLLRMDTANRVTVLLELLGNVVHSQIARKNIMPV